MFHCDDSRIDDQRQMQFCVIPFRSNKAMRNHEKNLLSFRPFIIKYNRNISSMGFPFLNSTYRAVDRGSKWSKIDGVPGHGGPRRFEDTRKREKMCEMRGKQATYRPPMGL